MKYTPTVNQQRQQLEFPQLDSGLTVPVFKQGDDPIDAINHMMSFLSAVVTSRYPTTNNQLRNSPNLRKQVTLNDGRVTLQPVQGRQISFATGTTRTYTLGASGRNSRKQRTVICYNCKRKMAQMLSLRKEESRNIDREIALEKKIKQLDDIVYKRDQSAQTNSMNSLDPSPSCRPTKVEVPNELPKVNMVNTSLKKLKHHLDGFNVVVKERTTDTAIIKGSKGFEHTKTCFRDEIIPFVKALKYIFNTFDQYLIDELSKVQNVFHQIEQAVEQHRLESKTFEVKMNQVLNENERLLKQVINKDIVNIIMNSTVDNASVNMHECKKCFKLEIELLNEKDFIEKKTYDKLFRRYTTLEKHCISLEVDTQLN
ncbi:hypothetical protein Tco_0059085 [Tanacetum coccineum]